MTKTEQRRFIRELVASVRGDILESVAKMPAEWDGVELRQYIADKFADCVIKSMMHRRRRRDYDNTIIVTNL